VALLTLPKNPSRPPVDPLAEHQKQAAAIRADREKALAKLDSLREAWALVEWDQTLAPADKVKRIEAIDRDRKAARLAVASADEALELVADRATVAVLASVQIRLAELKIERQEVWTAARAVADELPGVVARVESVSSELRGLAERDRALARAEDAERIRGGLPSNDRVPAIGAGVGLFPLVSFDSDLRSTELELAAAKAGR
jgi:hypothetical protein